ncbi:MAG: hypothetical protein FD169_337 [Bacillota bacterium]|nr:MAG: hypothetical protein FD169_337 [Bacillota bacterium]MBS3951090.1 class I SAM-dependent methyltransferase [Peptococcaceae bacterium]
MKRQYVRFAEVYDKWMQNIDYTEWWQYLATTFSLYKGMRVLEVGCGTGSLTEHMLKAGLSVVASDNSIEMLTQAEAKLRGYSQCSLLRLDLRRLPPDLGKFDAVVAACDVVNYLRSIGELTLFLNGARQLLTDNGVLLFDVHGPGHITGWLNSPYYNRVGENSCYMLNVTMSKARITQHLTGFVRGANNSWTRFEEIHRQTFFEVNSLLKILHESGFRQNEAYEFGTQDKPDSNTLRIQIAAR